MEFDHLIKLIHTVAASGLEQFCYEEDGTRIQIQGGKPGNAGLGAPASSVQETAAADSARPQPAGQVVKSPLVGVFYEAPGEAEEPFVTVGDSVKKGQTLAIVEAMKLMNEIECDYDGVVQEILVKNGEAVEYGQPLFVISGSAAL